ncbi:1524_t:CDS:2, partial [Funneliformis caledonium]
MDLRDTRILVAVDFGITYSGFAYVHKENPENVVVNNSWPGREGVFKTPTALQYDERYNKVISWGYNAL